MPVEGLILLQVKVAFAIVGGVDFWRYDNDE
jgi:hypothetical protein